MDFSVFSQGVYPYYSRLYLLFEIASAMEGLHEPEF